MGPHTIEVQKAAIEFEIARLETKQTLYALTDEESLYLNDLRSREARFA